MLHSGMVGDDAASQQDSPHERNDTRDLRG
jgi:hypothetical protein